MSDSASSTALQGVSSRSPSWLSSLGAPAIAFGALASYAIFRAAANGKLIAGGHADIADSVCFALVDVGAVIFSCLAARSSGDPATRRAWLLIAWASVFSGAGSMGSTVHQIAHPGTVMPPWSNAIFGVAYALTFAGLLSFPIAPRRRADRITLSFDIATVALSGTMILWYWCERTGAFEPSTSLATKATVVGYPSADLVILLTAAILLVRSVDDRSRAIFSFMSLAYLFSSVADFWYGYIDIDVLTYQRNTVIDVCWFAGVLFISVAAAAQLRRSPEPDSRTHAAAKWMREIPLIAVALAFAMLFVAIADNKEDVEVPLGVGALVMTGLAIARQRISARETERLMEERAIRDARFRALVQNSSDVVLVLDQRFCASYVSPAIQGVLGESAERGLGRPFVEWVAADDREEAALVLARVAATPFATEPLRCRMVHADGTLRTMETLASNLLDDPAVEGIVLNSRDITQRTALEEQLQHTQKLEVVGRLAGGIAHDFNNLLMVIGANAEFVLSEDIGSDARREAAEEITSTTKRAAALTKQLLAFSRRQEARPVIVNPNDVVRHVERMLLRLMQHAARFETELTDTPASIEIDPGQLEQALLNLAVNSRDAMPSGGLLRMRTRNVTLLERTMVDRGVLAPGNYVTITVEDNGAGMSPEVRSRIFEPFFTTKPIGSGTGLGLAMVLGVVQQAGGQIQVRSSRGEGTAITLYLPTVSGLAPGLAARPQTARRGTGRILVVDDEEGVRTVLQRLLRRVGYEVDAVGDAATALAMLSVSPDRFDLVLSDILMPEKTGLELASELIEAKMPVSIVLMTGFADSATVRVATETLKLPVLRKPFEVDQLAMIVEDALSRKLNGRAKG
ncbi:MAG: response regulator [Gemmatimonadaceae bacterium]|nr:response regulator [Gemmatimonadaceae bacterium]